MIFFMAHLAAEKASTHTQTHMRARAQSIKDFLPRTRSTRGKASGFIYIRPSDNVSGFIT